MDGKNSLETISIEVTTQCNNNCSHCFARTGITDYSSLSIDLVKEIIAEGHEIGYRHLHITGGEPLIWKGLFEALDCSFKIGYKSVLINTNGALLSTDIAKNLAAYKGCSISVSLDGDGALHDRLRGKGSYLKTVAGIETALAAGIGVIVFTIARKPLLNRLPDFVDNLYKDFPGIEYLTLIQLFSLTQDCFALADEFLSPDDFIKFVKTVALLNLYGFCIIIKNNPLAGMVADLVQIPWVPQTLSLYQAGNIVIKADRGISLAHSCRQDFGPYEYGLISGVLASDSYQKAVAPNEKICPVCNYYSLCRKYGMVRPLEYCRDTQPEVPYCRRVLERIGT
jgi:MoaA/NifB/PqqE/SkfB family radical SAM enzyme